MRVLHVVTSLAQGSGGPLRTVLELSACAEKFGIESEIVGFGPVDIPDNPLDPSRIHALRMWWPNPYKYSGEFSRWLASNLHLFDGVVLHGLWEYPQWVCSVACKARDIPYACFPHGMLDSCPLRGSGLLHRLKKQVYWHWRERHVIEGARRVLFTTPRELEDSSKTLKYRNDGCVVTPYGVTPPASVQEQPVRQELMQPEGRRVALFLGRIHPIKNIELLVEAWAEADVPEEWHLILAGSGDLRYIARLARQVERRNLSSRVHFTGNVVGDDKQYLLRRSNWLLLPSKHENFGVVVLEAMRRNCAVAMSREVYISDYFDGFPGAAILPLNTADWVQFMRTRMTDDRWRRDWQDHCWQVLLRKFSVEAVAAGWADCISSVFNGTPGEPERALSR